MINILLLAFCCIFFVFSYVAFKMGRKSVLKAKSLYAIKQATMDAIPDLMFTLSKKGICLEMQTKKQRNSKNSSVEFIGQNIYEFEPKTGQDFVSILSQRIIHVRYTENQLFSKHNVASFNYQLELNRIKHDFEARCVLLKNENILAIIRDITDKKNLERELVQERNRAMKQSKIKSQFIANMSHEIRTPLNAVLGLTSVVLNTKLTQEQEKYLKIIQTSGDNLLHLINDILDFSKIEAGELTIEKYEFSIHEIVEEIINLHISQAKQKDISIKFQISNTVVGKFMGDAYRIKQILSNLVSNAIKFTDQGEVFIKVEEANQNTNKTIKKNIKFIVQDTGKGIPNKKQKAIFMQYIQSESQFNQKAVGTGLGLAICKRLVDAMKGKIGVYSASTTLNLSKKSASTTSDKPEKIGGSVFWFVLPIEPARNKEITETLKIPKFKHHKAAIIDDHYNYPGIHGLVPVLKKIGLRTKQYKDASGIHYTEKNLIIFINSGLSSFDAFKLAKDIKKNHSKIPVVFYSPVELIGDREYAKSIKIDLYLKLPVSEQDVKEGLLNITAKYFSNSKKTEQIHHTRFIKEKESKNKNYFLKAKLKTKGKPKILVVEDNEVNQLLIEKLLYEKGVYVSLASEGEEAIQLIDKGEQFDLIFMDITMPSMDGYKVTKEIRKRKVKVPIIAFTAHAFERDKHQSNLVGMNDFLSKPFKSEDISRILDKWVFNIEKPL